MKTSFNFPLMTASDIECRVGNFKQDGSGFSLLLYKDARVDMRVLDAELGVFGWQREHKELKNVMYCGVSIKDPESGEWLIKWDAGKESRTEAEKGEASDSFKRACVNWGLGRELYTAPFIWINAQPGEVYTKNGNWQLSADFKLTVTDISYNEKREIIHLVISDNKGAKRYEYNNGKGGATTPKVKAEQLQPVKPIEEHPFVNMSVDDATSKIHACLNKKELEQLTEKIKKDNPNLWEIIYPTANIKWKQLK